VIINYPNRSRNLRPTPSPATRRLWTDERILAALDAMSVGFSASQVAAMVSKESGQKVSRSSVLGIRHRMLREVREEPEGGLGIGWWRVARPRAPVYGGES
jgi:hypothetical protein